MDYPFTSKALIKIEKFKKSVNNYLAEVNMDNIIDILKIVPDFNEFMSISELYESSRMLAEKYQDIVEVIDVGVCLLFRVLWLGVKFISFVFTYYN
jgi:hypothetical protein